MVSAAGSYSVTVTNANGCSGTSAPTAVTYQGCPKPTNPVTSNLTTTSARLGWTPPASCAIGYQLQYRQVSTATWTTLQFTASSRNINGLTPGTTYEWRVQTGCQQTPPIGSGNISGPDFTTLTAGPAFTGNNPKYNNTAGSLNAMVYPNPAHDYAILQLTGNAKHVSVRLTDMAGKTLWQSSNVNTAKIQIPVSTFSNGTYLITITSGKESKVLKLVKE